MTHPEAIQFLYGLRWFGAKLGLGNTFKLAELAGNPQEKLRFIHVAGTNGKGSTCAMLESIYRASGLRVGLFTSPHLVSFGERIQVNRQPIAEADVARLVAEMQFLLERSWGKRPAVAIDSASQHAVAEHPTFFEVVTILALRYFVEQNCDLVIWETGLGGRLDSTNIVSPLASVITNIQFDHQKWLGETLASIAAEKAGIIKPGVPVVTATSGEEPLRVICDTARRQSAPLQVLTPEDARRPPLDTLQLPLVGEHQRMNALVAIATVRQLQSQLPVTEEAIRAGLTGVQWAGRLQLVTQPGGQQLLLDGAHNLAGAGILVAAMKQYFPAAARTLVLGILRDKDWPGMCEILAPTAQRILLVPVPSERSATPQELAEICRRANLQAEVTECTSLQQALELVGNETFVTVAGSLYLVGEAMELLQLSPASTVHERSLNEWGGVPGNAQPHTARP